MSNPSPQGQNSHHRNEPIVPAHGDTPLPALNPSVSSSRKPPASRRTWLFRAILFLISWGLLELGSYAAIRWFVLDGIPGLQRMQSTQEFAGAMETSKSETFHPYIGWTHNPDLLPREDCCGLELKTNRFGFFDSTEGIHQRSPDKLIVAISGGSVAWQMSCAGAEQLKSRLQDVPEYRDREIILVRLAQSGFKQPQALFALNYYMLMGAEFDIVINLDGFNETALPNCENLPANVALDYPQGWHVRTRDIVDPRDTDVSLRVFEIRGLRQRAAKAALRSPLRQLPSYQFLWYIRERRWRNELVKIEEGLVRDAKERQRAYIHSGPHPLAKTPEEALAETVRIWKQASLQMHGICQASGIRYIHAIQPNQYDVGSKPLSEYELAACYGEDVEYGKIVKQVYPTLRQEGESLHTAGVDVLDLTRIFAKTTETLYVDPFCHVNHRGSQMLAEAIGQHVAQSVSSKSSTER